jgi:nucleoside-diphosphate-sugar epimerase
MTNLLHLCSFHHRCLHDYGFTMERGSPGVPPRFFDPQGRLIEGELRSYERVHAAVRGVELVFHLGALGSVPLSDST